MEYLLSEIAGILDKQRAMPAPPMPFPEFSPQRHITADAWYAPYLKPQQKEEHGAACNDVTGQCNWNPGDVTLTLSTGLLKPNKVCRIYGLALLTESQLYALCAAQKYSAPGIGPISITISRTSLFCIWDELLGKLLLSQTPYYLPPFFEARKMIQIDVCLTGQAKASSPCVIDLSQVNPLFGKDVFFPGYLIPQVEIKENQTPKAVLQGTQYQHYFVGLNLSETLFLRARHEDGGTFVIHCHEIKDGQYQHSQRIQSYTVVSKPRGGDNSSPTEDQVKLFDILQNLQSYRIITKDFEPTSSFFNNNLTAIPSRGDLHQLLACLPFAKKLGLSIEAIDLQTIDCSDPSFKKWMLTNRLTDYGWYPHQTSVPMSLPGTACRAHLIALTFRCTKEVTDIFYDNFLDYVCSYLNQHFWGAYRVIPANRLKGPIPCQA